MTADWPRTLVLAGAGKMGGALLRGWLAGGLAPEAVWVIDPHLDEATKQACRDQGVHLAEPDTAPDVLVLAVKPQTFAENPGGFRRLAGPKTLVVSILAGKTIADLRAGLPEADAIVRAMPNLPAAIGKGASGLTIEEGKLTTPRQETAKALLEAVGHAEWVDEIWMDAVTAVSGSGPAYVFLLTECLAEAGLQAGLPAHVALKLARATVEGAAAMLAAEPDRTPASMREAVTSPGGTTAAALEVLMTADGLESLMVKAVAAARRRAAQLAS